MATAGSLAWEDQATGANDNTWGDVADANFEIFDTGIAGFVSISTTGGTTILTQTQNNNPVIRLTGTLISNATIQVLSVEKNWTFLNLTDGNFTVEVKTAAGTGKKIPKGYATQLYCNATNVEALRNDQIPTVNTTGGTVDAITATFEPAVVAADLVDGFICSFKSAGSNTVTTPTLNVNGTGALTIKRFGGGALLAGDINSAGFRALVIYNSSGGGSWELLNPSGLANSTSRGFVTLATTAEAQAMTDTGAKAITAADLGALFAKGTDIASAGTLNIPDGGFFDVTGTTTITDIDFTTASADGRHAVLRFTASLTLTHDGSTLDLPGGADIVTQTGDVLEVWQYNGNQIKAIFHRDNGRPIVETWKYVETLTASGTATLVSADLSAYRTVRLTFQNFRPATDDDALRVRLSVDGSASITTGYAGVTELLSGSSVTAAAADTSGVVMATGANTGVGNTTGDGALHGTILISNHGNTRPTTYLSNLVCGNPSGAMRGHRASLIQTDALAYPFLRITFAGGNIATGDVIIEGLV
jgi:hypothetical protein